MRIIIKNKTHYNSSDLRKFIKAGIKEKGAEKSVYNIFISYSNNPQKQCRGKAMIGKPEIWLTLPKTKDTFILKQFAQVIEHELDHTLGIEHHKDMVNWWEIEPKWHIGLIIRENKNERK